MFTEIPKANEEHDNYPCWINTVMYSHPEKVIKPLIRCKCGAYCGVKLHHVHPDGTITASYYHTEQYGGCGWHVFLKLKDWPGYEFLPG